MKITAKTLRRVVELARLASDPRAHIPVLAFGRLSTVGGRATITSTDLDTWVDVSFPVESKADETVLLDLAALSKRAPAGGTAELVRGHADSEDSWWVIADRRRLRVPHLDVSDWPSFRPDAGALGGIVEYDGEALRSALAHARIAVSSDNHREHLQNVSLDDQGCVVGTDGHRLHWTEGLPLVPAPGWLVPGAAVAVLLTIFDKIGAPRRVTLSRFASGLRFDIERDGIRVSVTCKVPDVTFPDWRVVVSDKMSGEERQTVAFSGPELLAELVAFKRAGVSDGLTDWTALSVDEGSTLLSVAAFCSGYEDARAEVALSRSGVLDPTALTASYLRDALARADGDVVVTRVAGALRPLQLDVGRGRRAFIMPKNM